MSANTPNTPAAQPIPVVGYDEPRAREVFPEYAALMRAARDCPSLYERRGFRRMILLRRKAFFSSFKLLSVIEAGPQK